MLAGPVELMGSPRRTVDVDQARAMANEALRGPEEIIEANTEAYVLDDLVRVLGVDIVLYGHCALLGEVLWRDLDEIGDLGLNGRETVRVQ